MWLESQRLMAAGELVALVGVLQQSKFEVMVEDDRDRTAGAVTSEYREGLRHDNELLADWRLEIWVWILDASNPWTASGPSVNAQSGSCNFRIRTKITIFMLS